MMLVMPSVAQVLEGPRGPVEFVGLKKWTASQLFDAIKEQEPDKPFHACAATLKSNLAFADAAAFGFMKQLEDGSMYMYTVVVGIEDDSGVQYRSPGEETIALPQTWQELQTVFDEDFGTFASLVQARYQAIEAGEPDKTAMLAEYFGANSETADAVWKLMDREYEDSDQSLALEVLAKDGSRSARAVATMVLGYFPDNESTWHALVNSLLDSEAAVRDVAGKVLKGLIRTGKTTQVNWSEAQETLLALFSGTNPWAFNDILESLVATEVDNEFALKLVQEKPELLIAHAAVEHERFRKPAHDFLTSVSGEDFGRDVEAWMKWITARDSDS